MMSEYETKIKNMKPCFGEHETVVSAWHCMGCVVRKECREQSDKRTGGTNGQQTN